MPRGKSRILKQILFGIYFIAFLKPDSIKQIVLLDRTVLIITVVVTLDGIYYYLRTVITKRKIDPFLVVIGLYCICLGLPTIVNHGNIITALSMIVRCVGITMLILKASENDPHFVLDCLYPAMEILMLVNLTTIVLFPNGMYMYTTDTGWESNDVWLLGLRNYHIPYLFFLFYLNRLYRHFRPHSIICKLRTITLYVVVISTMVMLKSGISIILFPLYISMLVFERITRADIKFKFGVGFYSAIWVLLISTGQLFSNFAMTIGKWKSLQTRLFIWYTTLRYFRESPILGHGLQTNEQLFWLQEIAAGATSSHNLLIDVLYRQGILGYTCFYIALFLIAWKLGRTDTADHMLTSEATIGFISFFFTTLTEGFATSPVVIAFLTVLYVTPTMESSRYCRTFHLPHKLSNMIDWIEKNGTKHTTYLQEDSMR